MQKYFIPSKENNYTPLLLSTPALVVMMVVVLLFNTAFAAVPVKAAINFNDDSLLKLHNAQRKEEGLPPLKINPELTTSALKKAQAMLESDCWSHYCPPGVSPWTFFEDTGYDYIYAGENLAEGFFDSESVMTAWMNSPSHRENVLKAEYEEVGFGLVQGFYQGRPNNIIIAVHFGTPHPKADSGISNLANIFNELPQPVIETPPDNTFLSGTTLEIAGSAPQATEVSIFDGTSEWVVADANQGIFTTRIDHVEEGDYKLSATSRAGIRSSNPSSTVTLTVDRTPDQISQNDIVVSGIDSRDILTVAVNHGELAEMDIAIGGQILALQKISSSTWSIELPKLSFELNPQFEISTTDMAGNSWTGSLASQRVLGQAEQIDLEFVQLTEAEGRVISASTKVMVNNMFLVLLALLFGVDFLAVSRTGVTRLRSRSHLHIGLLVIIVLIILSGTLLGSIGEGLAAGM